MSADSPAAPASFILTGARLIDPLRGLDARADLAILEGRIAAPDHSDAAKLSRHDVSGCIITPGLVDIGAHLREPGPRYKGSLESESAAALAGGYTRIAPRPDTSPILDSAAHVRTLCDRADEVDGVRLIPLGALTQGLEGQLLANMAGLKSAGCVALTNLRRPLADTRVLRRCLEYAATFDIPVIFHPEDAALAAGGCAHEGSVASRLGLPGVPATAETTALAQWLLLIEQTGVRAHAAHLSCARSVALIEEAKQRGLPVTCDVSMAHLHWSDAALEGFDTLFHLQPPLRTLADRDALRDGVTRGVIDAIVSGHLPHEQAAKMAPFAASEPGMSTLETTWAMGWALVEEEIFDATTLVNCLSAGPTRVLGLKSEALGPGALAELAVFDLARRWTPDETTLHSAGLNTPLLNQPLNGRCVLTLIGGEVRFNANN
ncbi:dihydroorotase [Halomonas sp. M20]|uniref:dihydroorotase n=1 Tax=Halomonas sp. M20 TaxID=2763264 RepID=UPI001D09CAEF|nr:dihydroorotase [Halomonas sp. M20]